MLRSSRSFNQPAMFDLEIEGRGRAEGHFAAYALREFLFVESSR